MVYTTKDKIADLFLYCYLVLFPFGQLLRIQIPLNNGYLAIFPTDFFVFLFLLFSRIKIKRNDPLIAFFSLIVFSFVLNINIYSFPLLPGLGFIVRLFSYLLFWYSLKDFVDRRKIGNLVFKSLIVVLTSCMVFGWFQYIFYSDLRFLYPYGWDDHLNRLAGSFLDPGFTGLILGFGFITCVVKFIESKNHLYSILAVFFFATVGLTYSRASIIALVFGLLFVLLKYRKYLWLIFTFVLIGCGIWILPKSEGEGTNLRRTFSVISRLENYNQTIEIFKQNPVFGVGYNNLCHTKSTSNTSHSCSGSDNGILLIASTLGVLGLFTFAFYVYCVIRQTSHDYFGTIFIANLIALFIHMQFNNSLLYPWVLGVLGLQYAISRK
jgi:hypothetical protein